MPKIHEMVGRKIQTFVPDGSRWPDLFGVEFELENVLERGVILAPQGGWIELPHLFANLESDIQNGAAIGPGGGLESDDSSKCPAKLLDAIISTGISLDELEQSLLNEAVKRSNGNLAGAARLLGVTRPQLQYRLKRNST